jgi:cysteine desulfurase
MHSDCVQLIGKSHLDFASLNLDYATFSAHKIYATKGLGFVYIKKNSPWQPLIHGGGQERSRRGGTENILGVAALGIVFDLFTAKSMTSDLDNSEQNKNDLNRMKDLRDYFENQILMRIPFVSITSAKAQRLVNTSSLVISGVDGETLLMSLDLKGFSVSTGAACSSGNPEPSPVLLAMGLSRDEAQSSLRVSLGLSTTLEQIQSFVECLCQVVTKLRQINSDEIKIRDKKSELYEAN